MNRELLFYYIQNQNIHHHEKMKIKLIFNEKNKVWGVTWYDVRRNHQWFMLREKAIEYRNNMNKSYDEKKLINIKKEKEEKVFL